MAFLGSFHKSITTLNSLPRYLQSAPLTFANQTNSTGNSSANPTDTTISPANDDGGSLLSAWYLWVGILAGIIVIFGGTILMWYLAKVYNKKILCFGPVEQEKEEEVGDNKE